MATLQEERKTGIGGSDASVILGRSSWKTPLQLWSEKTGRIPEPSDNAHFRRGRKLEAIVADEYELETGRKVRMPQEMFVHPEHSWMIVHLDRIITDPNREDEGALEAKSANVFKIFEWEEEAPLPALIQLQHGLAVTGMKWGSVAGLLGGIEFRYQDLERNESFIAKLIAAERSFWKLVEADTPPEPVAGDVRFLNRLFEMIEGKVVNLPEEALAWDRQRLEASVEIKRLEELKAEAEAKLKFALHDAEVGILPDGSGRYTYKSRKGYRVEAYDVEPQRILRRASR